MSFAERCSTSSNVEGKAKFHYDYIVRMEEFDKGLEKVFAHANLEYHPYKKTLIMFLCLLTEQTTTDNTQQIEVNTNGQKPRLEIFIVMTLCVFLLRSTLVIVGLHFLFSTYIHRCLNT